MTKARAILGLIVLLGAAGIAYAVLMPPAEPEQNRFGGGRAVPVIAYTVAEGEFVERIEALGTIRANESVTLSAQVTEKVTKVNFDDGEVVEEGDVLLEFTSREESALLAEAQATLDEAEKQLVRIEGLVANGNATRARLDEQIRIVTGATAQVNAIEARLADRLLKAPFAGILGFRQVSPGTLVEPGTAVVTLDDIDPVKLDFSVPERFLGVLRPGLDIEAESAAYDDKAFKGTITAIDSRIDPVTRAAFVRALVPNPDGLLRPGMLVTINVIRSRQQMMLIPEEAVVPRERNEYVFVIGEDETVRQQMIGTGRRQPGVVEILSGLNMGDRIVAEGTSRVRPGAAINVIEDRVLFDEAGPQVTAPDALLSPAETEGDAS